MGELVDEQWLATNINVIAFFFITITFDIDVIVFMPRVTMVVVSTVVGLFIGDVLGAAILTLGLLGIVGTAMPTLVDHILHELVVEGVVDRWRWCWHSVEQDAGGRLGARKRWPCLLSLHLDGRLAAAAGPRRDVEVDDGRGARCGRREQAHVRRPRETGLAVVPWRRKAGRQGLVRDVGDWQCVGRATDELVLAGATAAAGNPAGRPMPSMRMACALLTRSSFSSAAALRRAASSSSRWAANLAAAALTLTTALRSLLFADSASNLAISSGVHSDRGFLGAFFFTFMGGSAARPP